MKNANYHWHIAINSAALLFIGLLLRYWIGKRRFKRRSIAGLQQFRNYHQALLVSLVEKVLNILGTVLILAGIILYLIE